MSYLALLDIKVLVHRAGLHHLRVHEPEERSRPKSLVVEIHQYLIPHACLGYWFLPQTCPVGKSSAYQEACHSLVVNLFEDMLRLGYAICVGSITLGKRPTIHLIPAIIEMRQAGGFLERIPISGTTTLLKILPGRLPWPVHTTVPFHNDWLCSDSSKTLTVLPGRVLWWDMISAARPYGLPGLC